MRAAALRQHFHSTSTDTSKSSSGLQLAADWAWPEDIANPLSRLTLLTALDLSSNELTHVGCDVLASLRALSQLTLADNLVTSLDDVSLKCAGLRLTRLDMSRNRLTQLSAESLTSLSGLQQLDASDNPLLCDNDAHCVARRNFRRWLNDTVDRLTLALDVDDDTDGYVCHDDSVRVSYITGHLECDEADSSIRSAVTHHGSGVRQLTVVILVIISAVTVLVVASFILTLGLLVGRRYWRRTDVDYCKRRQAQLLQHDTHHHHHHCCSCRRRSRCVRRTSLSSSSSS